MSKTESDIQYLMNKTVKGIKNKIFDVIAAGLIIAILSLSLGVLELRDITLSGLLTILLECIPLCITSVLLAMDYYSKGVFAGKSTDNFKTTLINYSGKVDGLTGKHLDKLDDFCQKYNDDTLKQLQTNILKKASISYERFNDYTVDVNGNTLIPLKIRDKKSLKKDYFKVQVNCINEAKKLKIKGLNTNILLSSLDSKDVTDLGPNEKVMYKRRGVASVLLYIVIVLIISVIGIRDILQWGWTGILLIIFKLFIIFCSALTNHIKGYNDVTVSLVGHIARKSDILKQFYSWYDDSFVVDIPKINNNIEQNDLEK